MPKYGDTPYAHWNPTPMLLAVSVKVLYFVIFVEQSWRNEHACYVLITVVREPKRNRNEMKHQQSIDGVVWFFCKPLPTQMEYWLLCMDVIQDDWLISRMEFQCIGNKNKTKQNEVVMICHWNHVRTLYNNRWSCRATLHQQRRDVKTFYRRLME